MTSSTGTRRQIDLNTPEMTKLFLAAPVYRKGGIVTVRVAAAGEPVSTDTKAGVHETDVICAGGEPVIRQDGDEEYVPVNGWRQMFERYDHLGFNEDGTIRAGARGLIRAFPNPYGTAVQIQAPWGGTQDQEADCWFAAAVSPAALTTLGTDRYLIGLAEFSPYQLAADLA